MTSSSLSPSLHLEDRLKNSIRDVPNFPKQGILFKDITPILLDVELCKDIVDALYASFSDQKIDGIVGVESRGFLFGLMLAQKFKVPFIPIRKKGKLPYKTVSYEYKLEYGSAIMEVHADAITSGANFLVHDDLLATGGTAAAAAELIRGQGGHVAGFCFLVSLGFLNGQNVLNQYSKNTISLINY
ncbi:MAG TPA: adenine phosphoribosyltransferase [Bacteroidia bacterium]|nr:adenine phosphoribosyltransferase [Bacteroidia bacterium]